MRQQVQRWWLALAIFIFILGAAQRASAGTTSCILFPECIPIETGIFDMHLPRITVGCQVIDCCPGCPGGGSLDWRIRLKGELVESLTLQFENLSPEAAKQIGIKGNAKLIDGTRFQIGKGEVFLSGFKRDLKVGKAAAKPHLVMAALTSDHPDNPPVAIPNLVIDQSAVKKIQSAIMTETDLAKGDVGRVEVVIEQLLGPVVVNEFGVNFKITSCSPFPNIPVAPGDMISLQNNAGFDRGVAMIDGRRDSGCVNDEFSRGSKLASSTVNVGNLLTNGTCHSEVAMFSKDDAMQLITNVTAWNDSIGQVLPVDLTPNLLEVPVKFWIISKHKAIDEIRDDAREHLARASQLYNEKNYCGIGFFVGNVGTDYHDATSETDLLDATCDGPYLDMLERKNLYDYKVLNVYYVGSAGGSLTDMARGLQCGRKIFISPTADLETLAHEIGHYLNLGEAQYVPRQLPCHNLMESGGTGRKFITEGQCFRCNVNQESWLNRRLDDPSGTGSVINPIRSGSTRICPDATINDECPDVFQDLPN